MSLVRRCAVACGAALVATSLVVLAPFTAAPASAATTARPTVTGVSPASPSRSTTPLVKGTAESGSTLTLYASSACTGTALGSGTAAAFAGSGITATVPVNTTTRIWAKARKSGQSDSPCSTTSVAYTNDSSAPGAVTLTSVTPTSPSPTTTPVLRGTAEAGATVRLYATSGCTGTPLATGSAAALAAPGLTATVTLGSTTSFRATATDTAGNTSACSSPLAYKADLPDGGFEAATGNPAVTPYWTGADSLAGTPVVTSAIYTPGPESAPRNGKAWVWFGGFPDAGHTGSVSQSVVVPAGGAVALTFWYRNSDVSAPYDAQLLVQVDGHTVRTIVESAVADPAYTKQVVDLSAYADGAAHVLAFSYRNGGEGVTNMLVDDVSLSPVAGTRVPVPTVSGTSPSGQGATLTPTVTGSADAGSTVWLFADASCTGAPLGSGSAAAFAAGGIPAQVPAGATTTVHAKATAAGRDDSACSTTSATYRSVGAPDTTLTKQPKAKLTTRKKKATLVFAFASTTPGATFQCSVDGGAYAACTSGLKVKLKAGRHTFAVRAVAQGLTDPTPATWTGKVKRKKKR